MSYDYGNEPKPYALYIHGLGSGAHSSTGANMRHYFTEYEWLTPEIPLDPDEAMTLIDDYVNVFDPQLIIGTSLGGLLTVLTDAPGAVKAAVNAGYMIETALRKVGYGKHPYQSERENGETEYTIDEPLVQRYIALRESHKEARGKRKIALFSTDDELMGRENSKNNARKLEEAGFEIHWYDKFGHRTNQQAVKYLQKIINDGTER